MRQRITGDARDSLRQELKIGYEAERRTIRDLAARFELSYGRTRDLLREAGTELRSRGGDMRSPRDGR